MNREFLMLDRAIVIDAVMDNRSTDDAAKQLNISEKSLLEKMRHYGIKSMWMHKDMEQEFLSCAISTGSFTPAHLQYRQHKYIAAAIESLIQTNQQVSVKNIIDTIYEFGWNDKVPTYYVQLIAKVYADPQKQSLREAQLNADHYRMILQFEKWFYKYGK